MFRGGRVCGFQDGSANRKPGDLFASDIAGWAGGPSRKTHTRRGNTGSKMEEWLQGKYNANTLGILRLLTFSLLFFFTFNQLNMSEKRQSFALDQELKERRIFGILNI